MIFDFHTHVFPEKIACRAILKLEALGGVKANTTGTISGLKESMQENGIDYSLVLPVVTAPEQFDTINKVAIETNNSGMTTGIYSFGGIHPFNENVSEKLAYLKAMGIKGIKIHPDYQGVYIDDDSYVNIVNEAFKLGLIVVTHAGIDIGFPDDIKATPQRIKKLLSNLKYQGVLILAHMGGWRLWDEVIDSGILDNENVFLDTAFSFGEMIVHGKKVDMVNKETFMKMLSKLSSSRILFASDSPWENPKEIVETLNSFDLDKDTLDSILFKNAMRLLDIAI